MNIEQTKMLFEKLYKDKDNEDAQFVFNVLFVSLISSDTCIDEESCENSLDELVILNLGLEQADVPDEFKKEYKERIELGISIVRRDLNSIKNGDFGMC